MRRALSSRAAALGCDVAAYHRDGFTVPSWSLPPERLRLAQEALDRLLEMRQGGTEPDLISYDAAESDCEKGLWVHFRL